jgi:hypothetical protein
MQMNVDDDDITVITSNTTATVKAKSTDTNAGPNHHSMAATARALFGAPGHNRLQKLTHAIMDTGATAIFIMEGTPVENKRIATKPLIILGHQQKCHTTHSPTKNTTKKSLKKNADFDTFDSHVMVNFIEPNLKEIIFTPSRVGVITQDNFGAI